MINYHPIAANPPWSNADNGDLVSFDWQRQIAVFAKDGDSRRFEICFPGKSVLVRMLDEFPLSTESRSEDWVGLIPHHFAYSVEGDAFFEAQSDAWRTVEPNLKHYRFMTGAGCLDVITCGEPHFRLVDS